MDPLPPPNRDPASAIQVGIVTKGKPTLGMVLTSLLLQDAVTVRIHVVDTSSRPVVNRDDVRFALRLASDRGIQCSYDYVGESDRAFSNGKARLIQELRGIHLCLMDDDIVMPSVALARLADTALHSGTYGYISPFCLNAPHMGGDWGDRPTCTPGSLIYQDELVHQILLEYYETSTDVLDRRASEGKVWEPAFLTALFETLGRPGVRQGDTVIYHLDYHEDSFWIAEERTVRARSVHLARELIKRTRTATARPVERSRNAAPANTSFVRGASWLSRARRALRWWL